MLISIEGITHSGKTSVIEKLILIYPNIEYFTLNKIHIDNEDSMTCLLRRSMMRANIQEKISLMLSEGKTIVIESYYLWYLALSTINGIPELHDTLSKTITKPDLIVLFDCDVNIAYNRIGKAFDKTEELRISRVYHQDKHITINTTHKKPTEITKKLIELIHKHKN